MNAKTKTYYELRVPGDGEFDHFVPDFSDTLNFLIENIEERSPQMYIVKVTLTEERLENL